MSISDIFNSILIMPLKLFFEFIFHIAHLATGSPGLSIVVLSLIMNLLVLPLYRRADAIQEEQRLTELRLRDGIAHIRKTFRGDERMMILQTYYKQNHYRPTDVFRQSVSLLLEIPFFMAAYQFLSHLQILNGASYEFIRDLGVQDGLLVLENLHINILPIVMTAVNLVSCVIFTKGHPLRTKIQLYAMALFFLFFLYDSPAGLVFYWTLNNIFSLVKTIFYKIRHPKRTLCVLMALAGAYMLGWGLCNTGFVYHTRVIVTLCIGPLLILPLVVMLLDRKLHFLSALQARQKKPASSSDPKLFLVCGLFLTLLIGLLIPTALVQSSPQEFVDSFAFVHPMRYVIQALCISGGLFLVWMEVFYHLSGKDKRHLFEKGAMVCSFAMLCCYMFFSSGNGILSNSLIYENGMSTPSVWQLLLNLTVILLLALVVFCALKSRFRKYAPALMLVMSLAVFGMGIYNTTDINHSIDEIRSQLQLSASAPDEGESEKASVPTFTLSKTGKNVVVIMLDRAYGPYMPYLLSEKPELKEMFSGFTWYKNTISFGAYTNFATPSLFGGYDYTPEMLNSDTQTQLQVKHDRALRLMPANFSAAGYDVTVFDPPYAGYRGYADLSIYDDLNIHTAHVSGAFTDESTFKKAQANNERNFFCYSLMKAMPLGIQSILYEDGNYNNPDNAFSLSQYAQNTSVAHGVIPQFANAYNVLANMQTMTRLTDEETNTCLIMDNETTHQFMMLSAPDYTPAQHVDNTEYDKAHQERFTQNGPIRMDTYTQIAHYHANMAALLRLGEWMDYLRQENVYDNTRIIIVSDHGRDLGHFQEFTFKGDLTGFEFNIDFFMPLMLVKDFNADTFTVSDEYMTNADVPTLAFRDLIEDPVDPATGAPVTDAQKQESVHIFHSDEWNISENNGAAFHDGHWLTLDTSKAIYDPAAWSEIADPVK